MDDFLTIYRKDYTPKSFIRSKKLVAWQEFKDPINEGFRHYLKLNGEELKFPREEFEKDYMIRFKEEYPILAEKYFSTPIDASLIEKSYQIQKQSIYQSDYCDMERERLAMLEALARQQEVELPDDLELPLTTTAFTYRNPTSLKQDAFKRVPPIRPNKSSTIAMTKEIQDILHITTGDSEYGGVIGELGRIITEDQIHGKIVHPKCTCAKHNLKNQAENTKNGNGNNNKNYLGKKGNGGKNGNEKKGNGNNGNVNNNGKKGNGK